MKKWVVFGLFLGFLGGMAQAQEYYSPEDNIEAVDIKVIKGAKKSLDIAMYGFTDKKIAQAIIDVAKKGVIVRIYRDGIQYKGKTDVSAMFKGVVNISVRLKDNSPKNIMHLKAYEVDGVLLRTGSANWSPQGEGAFCAVRSCGHQYQQDNNADFSTDAEQIKQFEETFDRIWLRGKNKVIQ